MPPQLALLLWVILLAALLWFDPANLPRLSRALWLPVIWLFFVGSRLPSQWLGSSSGLSAQALQEGSPLDRVIYLILMLLALWVLTSRAFRWDLFLTRNAALTAFLLLALLSAFWSDFPLIAFKRWFRDIGAYLVILVALSDPQPLEAIRAVLRRTSYLLIPLSIVLDKYYPQLSKEYDPWTGAGYYAGAATSKNMLGVACLVSGLFFFWDTVTRWPEKKQRRTKRILLVNAAFFAMTLSLLHDAQSTTSDICLILGCLVVAAANIKAIRRRPALLKFLIPATFLLYIIMDFGFGLNQSMAVAVGKDPTLHDRTKIWGFLIGMHTNPIVGTGYQSFWLGPRLEWFWDNAQLGHINEAHNGFLEVYLELGLAGIVCIIALMAATYRGLCKRLDSSSSLAVLGLATWIVLLFYNMSEAAFEAGLLYMVFLTAAIAPAKEGTRAKGKVQVSRRKAEAAGVGHVTQVPGFSSHATAQRR
jgi:O-antigen ligase